MSTFIDLLQRFGTMGLPALLLMVVGLVSAPLLVRRVLRGEARVPRALALAGGGADLVVLGVLRL
jgi:hypothetical protein